MTRVIVCGGRNYRNEAFIWRTLDKLNAERPFTAFMQGGATGADWIAKEWASTKPGLERWVCRADWNRHGKAAGPIRNARMMEWHPDLVVGFPDPESVGTWNMLALADRIGVEVIAYLSNGSVLSNRDASREELLHRIDAAHD